MEGVRRRRVPIADELRNRDFDFEESDGEVGVGEEGAEVTESKVVVEARGAPMSFGEAGMDDARVEEGDDGRSEDEVDSSEADFEWCTGLVS